MWYPRWYSFTLPRLRMGDKFSVNNNINNTRLSTVKSFVIKIYDKVTLWVKICIFISPHQENLNKLYIFIWSIHICGSKTWTLRKMERNYLEAFEICCWRSALRLPRTERMPNNEILRGVSEKGCWFMERRSNVVGHHSYWFITLIEGSSGSGRSRQEYAEWVKEGRRYVLIKRLSMERNTLQAHQGLRKRGLHRKRRWNLQRVVNEVTHLRKIVINNGGGILQIDNWIRLEWDGFEHMKSALRLTKCSCVWKVKSVLASCSGIQVRNKDN